MKVLIKLRKGPEKRYFVSLCDNDFACHIRSLIDMRSFDEAIMRVLDKARFVDELARDEKEEDFMEDIGLVLTPASAWYNNTVE